MSDEELRVKDPEYLTDPPEVVPAGKILVHNQGRAGTRGFRAWLAPATERDRYEPCDCGWAPKLGTHLGHGSVHAGRGAGGAANTLRQARGIGFHELVDRC